MEWLNINDQKPKHDQIVLASINGVYKITKYDALNNRMTEVGTDHLFFLNDPNGSVYWAEIETPAT